MRSILRLCVAALVVLACGAYIPLDQRASAQTAAMPVQASLSMPRVIISEFRTRGPAGDADEFVELYNNSDADITVQSVDETPGWTLTQAETDPVEDITIFGDPVLIPNGTVIPARGHLLITCASEAGPYSLDSYAAGDIRYPNELIPEGTGIALFATSEFRNYSSETRLDAVGFQESPGLSEGRPLPKSYAVTSGVQYSYVRRLAGGFPQDTNDNAADFMLVAVDPSQASGALLGSPGPENASSPVQHNGDISLNLLDPSVSSSSAPNRERRSNVVPNGNLGTLVIRRTVVNNTKQNVTALRFRVVNVTSLGTENTCGANPCADVRVLTSQDGEAGVGGELVQVRGVRLEEAQSQAKGGGWNSSLAADFVSLKTPLPPGESINIQFVLGVMRSGTFRFFVNVEALTSPANAVMQSQTFARR